MTGDGYPIFWKKDERFKIPERIKLNDLETLHLSCGRKTNFKDIEKICGNSLKYLIVDDMLVDEFSMPKMPKLEKLLISYGNVETNLVNNNNKKINDFRNFENVPNLNCLDLDIDFGYKNGIKLGNFGKNSKIKELKIRTLNPKYVDEIAKIKSLESLNISLFDNEKKITTKNFKFLRSLKNLKHVRLSGGYYASIEADFKKIMLFINKDIKELEIDIFYKEDNHNTAYECIREINNRFKHLKKLSLDCSSYFIDNIEGSNFKYEKNSFNFEEKKGVYCDKKNKLKSDHIKYKFNFDIKAINNLKKLETLFFNKNYEFNNQIINEDELFKFNKLSRIVTDTALFNNKFYSNIKKRQNEYYLNCKKLKKYKSIKSAYYLEGKHWERYKELGINIGYGYYGKSAEDILEERKRKKNETAN